MAQGTQAVFDRHRTGHSGPGFVSPTDVLISGAGMDGAIIVLRCPFNDDPKSPSTIQRTMSSPDRLMLLTIDGADKALHQGLVDATASMSLLRRMGPDGAMTLLAGQ